ncbi:hypothetical protein L3X38_018485 [Prunus dulcis]|uniref:Uncharacterized protein n=1 Tax=Prunus dulcis TaxID=3755 RepID=A0AAD4W9B1_PRUDU|nr:hypothetical protein L3X38_018485 [Prunus dulcis]
MDELSGVNNEGIFEEVPSTLIPTIQAEVKLSVLEISGKLMREVTSFHEKLMNKATTFNEKVINVVSSFMKDARHHLIVGHGAVNANEGDEALKKSQQGDENVVTNEDRIGSHWYLIVVYIGEQEEKALDNIYINDEIVTDLEKGWEFAKFIIVRSDKASHKKMDGIVESSF